MLVPLLFTSSVVIPVSSSDSIRPGDNYLWRQLSLDASRFGSTYPTFVHDQQGSSIIIPSIHERHVPRASSSVLATMNTRFGRFLSASCGLNFSLNSRYHLVTDYVSKETVSRFVIHMLYEIEPRV